MSSQRFITLADLGRKLGGRSRSSIYRDIENGRIPKPIKFGSRLYWREGDIDELHARLSDDRN